MSTNKESREKADRVRGMFGRIAGRYDLLNRVMTFGQDRAWRREMLQGLNLRPGELLLDVGSGSGDLVIEAQRQEPGLRIIACDFTPEMITVGRARQDDKQVQWVLADAEYLPFQASSFDAVASGFLLRNVSDLDHALAEQFRILNNQGRFAALDTTPPESAWLKPLVRIHLHVIIPLLGRVLAGDLEAYQYLPDSTEAFLPARALAEKLKQQSFRAIGYVKRMLGTIAIHWAVK